MVMNPTSQDHDGRNRSCLAKDGPPARRHQGRVRADVEGRVSGNDGGGTRRADPLGFVREVQRNDERLIPTLKSVKGVRDVQLTANGTSRLVVEYEGRDEISAEISKAVVGLNVGLLKMSPLKQSLEDYYLSLVGGSR